MVSDLDPDDELVPLYTDFDVVWRGCDRGQVAEYVERVETELRFLEVDRDAATRRADALAEQLAAARTEMQELTQRQDRLVELAQAEAGEIVARAHATAEQTRASAEEEADRLRRQGEDLVEEAFRRRRDLDAEHQERTARLAEQEKEAASRRQELDDQAAEVREQVETDFELATRSRRAETMRELADQRAAAEAEAEQLVADAREQLASLIAQRDRIMDSIRAADELLEEAGPLLAPMPEEQRGPRAA